MTTGLGRSDAVAPAASAPATPGIVSLIEQLLSQHGLTTACATIMTRRRDDSHADVRLFLNSPAIMVSAAVRDFLAAVRQLPDVESVKPRQSTISVRLSDAFVERAGRELERGVAPPRPAGDVDAREHLVGFAGPNTCKALHLGHLRNILIGNALASTLKTAGFRGASYSLVGDIGRNVAEAMAGCRLTGSGVADGAKPDHVIGRCYQSYVARTRRAPAADTTDDDPCGREHLQTADLADELLLLWRAGDASTRRLWQWVRDSVERGHDETLRELGVTLDRRYYESEHVDYGLELIARADAQGLLQRLDNGTLVYDTNREDFKRLVLVRRDGFPTEHGRIMAVFHRILARDGGCVHIDWNGTDWESAQAAIKDLMVALSLVPDDSRHLSLFHGMVTIDGEDMSSSSGEPVLIDELVDGVRRAPAVRALADATHGQVCAETVADQVIKAFFLCAPISQPLAYSWSRLMDPGLNRGWLIAKTWCRLNAVASQRAGAGAAADSAYRFTVLQGQSFPPVLAHAARTLDFSALTRFVVRCCETLETTDPAQARAARTVLAASLSSLGFSVPLAGGAAESMPANV